MRKLEVTVSGADIKLTELGKLTSGMVGAKVLFSFTPEWDGLLKIAVFKGNDILRGVPLTAEEVKIPPECLAESGTLWVGAYGFLNDGTIAIPTVRSGDIVIWPGASPSGEPAADPTPPLWVQLMTMMGDPIHLTTKDRSTLVAAINEIAGYKGMELDEDQINEAIEYYFTRYPPTIGEMTMTGDLDMGSHRVKNVADPEADGDAVPRKYAEDHFAPAGYGYGGITIPIGNGLDETALENQLEATYSAMEPVTTKLITYTDSSGWRWFGILSKSSANNGSFIAHSAVYGGSKIIKNKTSGTWRPLEWENPPMLPGVEYRTIERWDNKPVYRKMVRYANTTVMSGDSTYNIPHDISDLDKSYGVEIITRTASYQIPYFAATEFTAVTGCSATNIELKTNGTTRWSANRVWYFDMKYVKTA